MLIFFERISFSVYGDTGTVPMQNNLCSYKATCSLGMSKYLDLKDNVVIYEVHDGQSHNFVW